jgi:TPR repeat protein
VHYLSLAASNSAEVEKLALGAGIKKGGAAKGELVLAMYELANCFRNGWGIKKDPAAAKQYYETAANLGDTDAMNEVAWCYTEGFGTKKDKVCSCQLPVCFSVYNASVALFSALGKVCFCLTGRCRVV